VIKNSPSLKQKNDEDNFLSKAKSHNKDEVKEIIRLTPLSPDKPITRRNILLSPLKNTHKNPSKPTMIINVLKPDENTNIEPIRKNGNLLKNINDIDKKSSFKSKIDFSEDEINDMENTKVIKLKKANDSFDSVKSLNLDLSKEIEKFKEFSIKDEQCKEEDVITHSGYLSKISKAGKLKDVFFKLVGKDIYFYRHEDNNEHKGMHNLSGIFVQKEHIINKDGKDYYCFSVIYPNKKRLYLSTSEANIDTWVDKIQSAIGYTNLSDIYNIKVINLSNRLGKNWYGKVRIS